MARISDSCKVASPGEFERSSKSERLPNTMLESESGRDVESSSVRELSSAREKIAKEISRARLMGTGFQIFT